MTLQGNEKISVHYDGHGFRHRLVSQKFFSHSNYKTRAHPLDYAAVASNLLINAVSLLNIWLFA